MLKAIEEDILAKIYPMFCENTSFQKMNEPKRKKNEIEEEWLNALCKGD